VSEKTGRQKKTQRKKKQVYEINVDNTDRIIQVILGDARRKVKHIQALLEEKKQEMRNEIEKHIQEEVKKIEREAKQKGEMVKNQVISSAEMEGRRLLDEVRHGGIEDVFRAAGEQLAEIRKAGDPGYREFLVAAGKSASSIMPRGSRCVVIRGDGLAARVFGEMGFKVEDGLGESEIGGAVFVSPDGSRRLRATVKHIIERKHSSLLADVEHILYPQDEKKSQRGQNDVGVGTS